MKAIVLTASWGCLMGACSFAVGHFWGTTGQLVILPFVILLSVPAGYYIARRAL